MIMSIGPTMPSEVEDARWNRQTRLRIETPIRYVDDELRLLCHDDNPS